MLSWLYLTIAALFEIGWGFSLKFLSFKKVAAIEWQHFFKSPVGMLTLLPLIAYIILGLGNVYFFALAIKQIPTSVAFAVWMAISLVGVKLIDILVYKEAFIWMQALYFMLIIFGIFGLKRSL